MINLAAVAADVLRDAPTRPGYARFEPLARTSADLRAELVHLGRELAFWAREHHGLSLGFFSLNWVSQVATTRPHRDGGPDGSLLLLGYEPSPVRSRFFILDHSRCAVELGVTPRKFLEDYSPTFGEGARLLQPHTHEVAGFDSSVWQGLIINNSCLNEPGLWGVMHHAVLAPVPVGTVRPIVNVLMGVGPALDDAQIDHFIRTGTAALAGE